MHAPGSLLVLALAAGTASGARPPAADVEARASLVDELPAIDPLVAGLLARGSGVIDEGALPPEDVTEALLARPAPLHEALVSVLEHGAWRVPGTAEEPWVLHRLRARHRPWLRALAAELSPPLVLGPAREDLELELGAAPARLRAHLVLAGEVVPAREVALLGVLASGAGARACADDYEAALLSTLRRHAGASRELDAAWEELESALRLPALDALAACARPQAADVLAARLDDQPELRAAVLARLGTLAETLEQPVDGWVAAAARALLDDARPALRREAALCVGRLQDAESAPRLVELLADGERGERDAAVWALRRISTLGFSADPRPWRLWLGEERTWWSEHAVACLQRLGDPRPEVALAALDEVARRRLHRDELARAVVGMGGAHGELLERRCHALRALGSRAGLGFLRECLEHSDAAVRAAAEGAWRASTQLPPPAGAGVASGPR